MEAWIEIPNGKFLARTVGKEYGNVLLRKEQYRIYDNLDKSNLYARNMILGKVYNCRWSIERTLRDHEYRGTMSRKSTNEKWTIFIIRQYYDKFFSFSSCFL